MGFFFQCIITIIAVFEHQHHVPDRCLLEIDAPQIFTKLRMSSALILRCGPFLFLVLTLITADVTVKYTVKVSALSGLQSQLYNIMTKAVTMK